MVNNGQEAGTKAIYSIMENDWKLDIGEYGEKIKVSYSQYEGKK